MGILNKDVEIVSSRTSGHMPGRIFTIGECLQLSEKEKKLTNNPRESHKSVKNQSPLDKDVYRPRDHISTKPLASNKKASKVFVL